LLTCAIDLNGKIEDARLDYEIVGWSREGASYSIIHGSIGTFVRGEGEKSGKMDRELWTYQHGQPNNVWRKMDEILDTIYVADDGSKRMKVYITGLDTGNFTAQAYEYLERSRHTVIGLKGDTEEKYNKLQHERSIFKKATNRTDLYILKVDAIKDMLSQFMGLTWDRSQPTQPLGFMNFPQPSEGLYGYENYFEHYEAERYTHKINSVGEMIGKWEKKTSMSQNHMWDCRVYNIAMKEIFLSIIGKQFGVKELTWQGFCNAA